MGLPSISSLTIARALAHKMLRTIYTMPASGTHYQDRSADYEALSVARNAPRWIKMLRKHGFIATPAATAAA